MNIEGRTISRGCTLRLLFLVVAAVSTVLGQSSGYSYMTYYFSPDSGRLYATTVTAGQMQGGSGNSHVYTAYTNISGPPGTQAVGCGEESSGNVPAEYYNSVQRTCYIDVYVPGTYSLTTRGTAYCTAVSYFFYDTLYQVTPTNVDPPVITGISPNGGLVTASIPVTIVGTNLGPLPSLSVTGGITTSNVSVNAARTEIKADFQIPSNQEPSHESATVSVGGRTANIPFRITVPTSLRRTSEGQTIEVRDGNVVDSNGQVVMQHACGVYRNYTYEIVDNNSPAQVIAVPSTFYEYLSNYSANPSGTPPPDGIFGLSGGSVRDLQMVVGRFPICLGPNDHESFDMHHAVVIQGKYYYLTTATHVNRGYYAGTPTVNNSIVTP